MKSIFANARENLSDEQLKHVTGGARVSSRPEAPEDHLIDHGDLHGAAVADDCRPMNIPSLEQSVEYGQSLKESIQFSKPVTVRDLEDTPDSPTVGVDRIEVFSDGDVWAIHGSPGQPDYQFFWLGENYGNGAWNTQTIIKDATSQGDQVSITGAFLHAWIPDPNKS